MSEPDTAIAVEAVLLNAKPSLSAPVVPFTVALPVAVGIPVTVHVIVPSGFTVAGGVGVHDVLRPAGRPETAHVAFVAATKGAAAFEHVKLPV